MPRLIVPEQFRSAFVEIAKLNESTFSAVVRSLTDLPPVASPPQIAKALAAAVKDLPEPSARRWALALMSLMSQRSEDEPSKTDDFSQSVAMSSVLDLTEKQRTTLAKRLGALEEIPSLSRSSKAIELLLEHERVFVSARILTDVRPVFEEEIATVPSAAVTFHTLRISYLQDAEFQDFFVALDDDDVVELRRLLDRTTEKSEAVHRFGKQIGLTMIETGDRDPWT